MVSVDGGKRVEATCLGNLIFFRTNLHMCSFMCGAFLTVFQKTFFKIFNQSVNQLIYLYALSKTTQVDQSAGHSKKGKSRSNTHKEQNKTLSKLKATE